MFKKKPVTTKKPVTPINKMLYEILDIVIKHCSAYEDENRKNVLIKLYNDIKKII
jgi:hypothetical protein